MRNRVPKNLEAKVLELAGLAPALSAPPADLTEEEFQAGVVRRAQELGWRVYHTRDSRKSAGGFPDLVMLNGARAIVAELKVGANVPTADQFNWLEAFAAAGVHAYVWRPDQWAEIEATLRG